jgi:hypothetical protein
MRLLEYVMPNSNGNNSTQELTQELEPYVHGQSNNGTLNSSFSAIPSNAKEVNTPQKPPKIRFSNTLNLTKFNTTLSPNTVGQSPSYKKSITPPRSAMKQRYKPYGGRHTRKRRTRRTQRKKHHKTRYCRR